MREQKDAGGLDNASRPPPVRATPLTVSSDPSAIPRTSGGSTSSTGSDAPGPSDASPRHKSSTTASAGQSSIGSSIARPADERGGLEKIQNVANDYICPVIRQIVSQNRRRWQQNGFDLDLTYITDRIIAMGYPADTTEALYRNSMADIVRFLESRHGGHYKVFNLRGQYVYDTSKFQHRVVSFEMTDHHPPRLELMAPFCREAHDFLIADPRNIVAVHCKAGKGRTGVMICAYLIYINFYRSPRQNMDYYSIVRTMNNKGVTIPSQRRYIYYFSHLRRSKLNYMPLRVELVGVYLERPPRVGTAFARGALTLRVAQGDVDVFFGDDMWLTKEQFEEDEKEWVCRCSRGPDSYDPLHPMESSNVISRRAYGWTVPSNRRVFLEGDVRIDVYSKTKIKMLNYETNKEKLGHVWFNTMFVCSNFCGGHYQHGDEAYPYPPGETTIASRQNSSQGLRPKSGSASVPNSPPASPKPRGAPACRAPSFDARKSKSTGSSSRLHHAVKKITDGVASRNSEPNIERRTEERGGRLTKKRAETACGGRSETAGDLELVLPPGLEAHCPAETLPLIYGASKPPREEIEKMLLEAHTKELISDTYNQRRLSVPQDGTPVNKAPEGRPTDGCPNGPFCIVRAPDEHIQTYSVLEIDRAYKSKDIDPGFKIIVVTRCVPPEGLDAMRAAHFLAISHAMQSKRDALKQEKIECRQKRLASSDRAHREEVNQTSLIDDKQWASDPRSADQHLRKFFFRQRADSVSKYPSPKYNCPLLKFRDPKLESTNLEGADNFNGCDDENDVRSYHPDDGQWAPQSDISTEEGSDESEPDSSQRTIAAPSSS